jgi:hypothetical protein
MAPSARGVAPWCCEPLGPANTEGPVDRWSVTDAWHKIGDQGSSGDLLVRKWSVRGWTRCQSLKYARVDWIAVGLDSHWRTRDRAPPRWPMDTRGAVGKEGASWRVWRCQLGMRAVGRWMLCKSGLSTGKLGAHSGDWPTAWRGHGRGGRGQAHMRG